MYQVVARSPERACRFAGAMSAYTMGKGFETHYLLDNYDWGSLGKSRVVDVGGAGGHISFDLARRFQDLEFVVQDLKNVVGNRSFKVPAELNTRIKFMAHDFFTKQPIQADLYYFRWIFHNWPDKYSIKILRALIPALKFGARVLVHDICLPEPKTIPTWREKLLRSVHNWALPLCLLLTPY